MLEFDGNSRLPRFSLHGYAPLFIGMIALVFSQAALGAYVRHAQAGLACPDFPACQGGWLPPSLTGPVFLHYSHRLAGYGIALTAMALCGAAFLDRSLGRYRGKALLLVILSLAQIGAGALVVLSGLNFAAAAVHLAIALAILSLLFHLWVAELCKREGALSKAG
jgi:heme A synthase